MVASSCKSGEDVPHYPSDFPDVISVGASGQDDNISNIISFGFSLDLVASG